MAAWTLDELDRIGSAEEMLIAPMRMDGSLQKPVIIWVVRIGDELFVRSVRGLRGAWFRGVQIRHEGWVSADGIEKDVVFEDVSDPVVIDEIDNAYRFKYARYPQYVAPLFKPEARAATIKLTPCS